MQALSYLTRQTLTVRGPERCFSRSFAPLRGSKKVFSAPLRVLRGSKKVFSVDKKQLDLLRAPSWIEQVLPWMSRFKQTSTNPGQLGDEKLSFEEDSKTYYGTELAVRLVAKGRHSAGWPAH